ncbi:hypothetical protein L1987_47297 [Smallanthus sonchifolius]|uniref:Uncharacterized protein n=1 Tax=Smallanthus sonchifolius TaxID=185202 RepID=A0ACB9G1Z3_9ASTR|nr:hypothetical protein L1987_47297 [Smallanthus sonchifolius]
MGVWRPLLMFGFLCLEKDNFFGGFKIPLGSIRDPIDRFKDCVGMLKDPLPSLPMVKDAMYEGPRVLVSFESPLHQLLKTHGYRQ